VTGKRPSRRHPPSHREEQCGTPPSFLRGNGREKAGHHDFVQRARTAEPVPTANPNRTRARTDRRILAQRRPGVGRAETPS